MNTFRAFLNLEFKRFIAWRNALVLLSFFVLSMYLVHTGVQRYNEILNSKKQFREIEKLKVEQFNNYEQYGGYGFRLLFVPSPLSVFSFNSSLFSELACHIDVGEKLIIYNSFKGRDIFAEKPGRLFDFSGIMLLLGSLLALFYGYDSFRSKEYLKFLSSSYGHRNVFSSICLSRIILLCSFFIFITLCAILLLIIYDINLSTTGFGHLLISLLVMLGMLIFFFVTGTIAGIMESKFSRFFILSFWVASVFFIPATINRMVETKSDDISPNYQLELGKLKRLMDFEKYAEREIEKKMKESWKKEIDRVLLRSLAEKYLKTGFETIQRFESVFEDQVIENIKYYQKLSVIFPSTYYLSISNEIGSLGYENIIRFYRYARDIKEQFLGFYIEKSYNSEPMPSRKIESFIEEQEKKEGNKEVNMFYAKSRLPIIIWWGLLTTVFWIGALSLVSYFLFKRSLFSTPKEDISGLNDLEIDLNKGESNIVLSNGKAISDHLYNVLSGKNKEFCGKVGIGSVNIVNTKRRTDFLYLCHAERVPWDIKIGDFVFFIVNSLRLSKEQLKRIKDKLNLEELKGKSFKDLEEKEKGQVLLEMLLLKENSIYMIDDFLKGMPSDFVKEFRERIQTLKREEISILYLTNDVFLARKLGDYITFLKKDAALMTTKL